MKQLDLFTIRAPNPQIPNTTLANIPILIRGFEVLWYVKRDVSANHTILDTYVWRNVTVNDLIQGSKKALNVLIQQPKVDP